MELAAGTAAEAAHRVANASYDVIRQADVRDRLKRILMFAKGSTFPLFSQQHEDSFHDYASWSGPSARNGSAGGLMALARPQSPLDTEIQSAIRELARDLVCDVRLQVIQNLYILRDNDPEWMWAEIEYVVEHEYTRQVVQSAIHALSHVAYMDIARALRIAKRTLHRYAGQQGPGIGQVYHSAASFIADIHFIFDNQEADEFFAERLADPLANSEILASWVNRYSENVLKGDNTGSGQDRLRAKTISFYVDCVAAVSDELSRLYAEHGLAKPNEWSPQELSRARALNSVLDAMAMRIYFTSGGDSTVALSPDDSGRRLRLYREFAPVLDRLAECNVVHTAYYLIQALKNFVSTDPAGVFALIVKSVLSSSKFGYASESMGADLIVRIVEEYLADHRDVFSDEARLTEMMACLNLFVAAGWPTAQALVFRLPDIWR